MNYIHSIELNGFSGIPENVSLIFPHPASVASKIILFKGDNRKGKSVIAFQLHPFARSYHDSNRDRNLISGEAGSKKIVYRSLDGSSQITILHEYSMKKALSVKSYFSFNNGSGEQELNPNGNATSFNETVMKYFGIDYSFLKIGRLTSIKGFTTLKPAERKMELLKYQPAVEAFLILFKSLKEQHNTVSKTMSYLTNELERYDIDKLTTWRNQLFANLELWRARLSELSIEQGRMQERLNAYDASRIQEIDGIVASITNDLNNVRRRKEALQQMITFEIDSSFTFDENRYNEVITEHRVLTNQMTEIDARLTSMRTKAAQRKNQVSSFKTLSTDDYNSMQNELQKIQMERDELLRSHGNNDIAFPSLDVLDDLERELVEYISMIERLPDFDFNNIETFIKQTADERDYLQTEEDGLREKLYQTRVRAEAASMMNSIPANCVSQECVFRVQAMSGVNAVRDIASIEAEINRVSKTIEILSEKMEHARAGMTVIDMAKRIFSKYEKYTPFINRYFNFIQIVDPSSIASTVSMKAASHLMMELKTCVDKKMKSAVIAKMTIDDLSTKINRYVELLDLHKESHLMRLEFEKDLEELRTEYTQAYNIMMTLQSRIEAVEVEKDDLEKKKIVNEYKALSSFELEAEANLTKIKGMNAEYFELRDNLLVEKSRDIAIANSELFKIQKELDKVNLSISQMEDYANRLKAYEETESVLRMMRTAVDPQRGIPLWYLSKFLKTIEERSNELLSFVYDDQFKIKFEISEKDFNIPVFKPNGYLKDVIDASDSEHSFIRAIISLSFFTAHAQYPILILDEIDAVLDQSYRSTFVTILEKQIERRKLSQLFLISHNSEVLNSPINAVIFPGGENIIKKMNINLIGKVM